MTYAIEQDSILAREMRMKIYDVQGFPLVIHDPRITEMHYVCGTDSLQGLTYATGSSQFIVTPPEAQASDWIWETFNNGIRFLGKVNPTVSSFNMEFVLE